MKKGVFPDRKDTFLKHSVDSGEKRNPALAVCARLKPARTAGGLPPNRFSASNVRVRSKPEREACDPRIEGGVPFKKCGFKRATSQTEQGCKAKGSYVA